VKTATTVKVGFENVEKCVYLTFFVSIRVNAGLSSPRRVIKTSIWCFRNHSRKSETSTSGVGLESTKRTTRVQN